MNSPTQLYMFAIMPPPDLAASIHNIRLDFAKEYGFVKSLKPPVHITLYPPFRIRISDAPLFEEQMSEIQIWAAQKVPFGIDLNHYGYFDNAQSPVLYIDVLKSKKLADLHSGFVKELKKHTGIETGGNPYKPHITIGYRDIDPKAFPTIKTTYSKRAFNASFECKSFYLWKHDGKNWQVYVDYHLNGIENQLSLF